MLYSVEMIFHPNANINAVVGGLILKCFMNLMNEVITEDDEFDFRTELLSKRADENADLEDYLLWERQSGNK